jgi:hypothetical protein
MASDKGRAFGTALFSKVSTESGVKRNAAEA